MVNVNKHKLLKKNQSINHYKTQFEKWLIDVFGDNKIGYYNYWGGINGAIHRKLNNWNPDDEEWYERGGLYYARSTNEVMLSESIFAGTGEMCDILWEGTKKFAPDLDVDLTFAMFDVNNYFYNMFDVFKLFDDAKKYDLLFFKNMTIELYLFLIDFGITECINYIFIFFTEEDSNRIIEMVNEKGLSGEKAVNLTFDMEPKYLKENKIGFELYENLTEWKKEVNAPTRNDPEYRRMKKIVRERDDFTCQCCGYRNTKKVNHGLEVHHIFGYKDHLDYRTEDSNCITLCNDCHKKYHSVYGKNNVTPITFIKFMREYNTYTIKSIQSTLD